MAIIEIKALSGAALDWAVAKVTGMPLSEEACQPGYVMTGTGRGDMEVFTPSQHWLDCGPLLEEHQVFIDPPHDVHRANYDEKTGRVKGVWETYETWHATVSARVRTRPSKIGPNFPGLVGRGEGETLMIAACRAIVASFVDDAIDVPDELFEDEQS